MNNLFNQIFGDVGFALAWTFLHSIWQFAILAFCYLGFSRLIKRSAMRYRLALGLFSLCALVSAATFFHYYASISDAHQLLAPTLGMAAQLQQQDTLDSAIYFFNSNLHLIMYVWLGGFFFHLCRTTLDYIQCKKLVQFHSQSLDEKWIAKFSKLEQLIGTTTQVIYKTSTLVSSPCVIGVFKPVILVPPALLLNLSLAQIEAILLHELAHIKRNDYLVNIVQCLVNSIFFFNPFLRYLSRKIDQERENACDDLAAALCASPLTYATSLGKLTELGLTNQLALAANSNKHSVLNRIKRLLGDFPTEKTTFQFFSSALIGILGLLMAANIQALPNTSANNNSLQQNVEIVEASEPASLAAAAEIPLAPTTPELAPAPELTPTQTSTPTPEPAAISTATSEIQSVQNPTPVAPAQPKADLASKAAIAYAKQSQQKAVSEKQGVDNVKSYQPLTTNKAGVIATANAVQSSPKAEEVQINAIDRNQGNIEVKRPKNASMVGWSSSESDVLFVNQNIDFSKYNQIIILPTTFDHLKLSEKTKKNVAKSWRQSMFKELDEYRNYFDRAAHHQFKKTNTYQLTNKGGDNVLAMEMRMTEFHPLSSSKNEPNIGTLTLQAILADSKTGELVAVFHAILNIDGRPSFIRRVFKNGDDSDVALPPGEGMPPTVAGGNAIGSATSGWTIASASFTRKLHDKMKRLKRKSRRLVSSR